MQKLFSLKKTPKGRLEKVKRNTKAKYYDELKSNKNNSCKT